MDSVFERAWTCLKVERDGSVATVTLNGPDGRNAMNPILMQELTEIARLLRSRVDVLSVVLTGGETAFSAGLDLGGARGSTTALTVMEMRERIVQGPDMCRAWEEIEAITIVAIEGYCIGGGCALAVSCDFRIMGEGSYMRLPEVPLGMNMSWRSIPRITTLVGPSRAKRFIMFGEPADAGTCLSWGMTDEVALKGRALEAARAWARKLVALPPLPVRMTKEAVNAAANANHHAASFMDRDQFLLTARTEDFKEGVAAFFEKRPGVFKGD